MKRVVSVSLGSSKRDKKGTAEYFGETVEISRVGTDGDQERFRRMVRELDGNVDAIGLGGIDRYLWSGEKRYEFRAARRLIAGVHKTPVLDGSGLKNTLEREAVRWLGEQGIIDFRRKRTLMVCGVDRFGMAEALVEQGGELVFGDLMFNLGLPAPIRSWRVHRLAARLLLPIITQAPFEWLYPTGEKQNEIIPKWGNYYRWADVIAGDFLLIRRYLPSPSSPAPLAGKAVVTNTTREADIEELQRRGVALVTTTTPRFEGGSFGTNAIEAALVALNGGKTLAPAEYLDMLQRLGWTPDVRYLQGK